MAESIAEKSLPISRISTGLFSRTVTYADEETESQASTQAASRIEIASPSVAEEVWTATVPEDWPNIPSLQDRRSCECSVTTLSPCVVKACDHLQRLLNAINCWLVKHTDVADVPDGKNKENKDKVVPEQLNLLDEFIQRFSSVKTPDLFSGLPALCLPELNTLGSDAVVAEVVKLLARLQSDIDETNKKLEDERRRVLEMEHKLEEMNELKLYQFPEFVQREHEACLNDINELNWHLSYRSRIETRTHQKLQKTIELNKKLKEELRQMKENIPYVEEKLKIELDNLKELERLQTEATIELKMTEKRLAQIDDKNNHAHKRAEEERNEMNHQIQTALATLRTITNELEHAELLYREYCDRIQQAHDKLKSNDEERKILEVKLKEACQEEVNQRARLKALKERLDDVGSDNLKLKQILKKTAAEHDALRFKVETTKKQLLNELAAKEDEIKNNNAIYEEAKLDFEELHKKLLEVKRRVIWCEQHLLRMTEEMEQIDGQMKLVLEEVGNAQSLLYETQRVLAAEQKKAKEIEAALHDAIQRMREQIEEEIHARTVLKARINNDMIEFANSKEAFKKKEAASLKLLGEVEKAVGVVETKVKALRATFAEKDAILTDLLATLNDIKAKYGAMESQLQTRIDLMTPEFDQAKQRNTKLSKDIDYLFWQHELLGKKLIDLGNSLNTLTKNMRQQDRLIGKLEMQLAELQANLQAKQRHQDSTRNSLNAVLSRMKEESTSHADILESRHMIFNQQNKKLANEIDRNTELASQYRKLQNSFLIMKEQVHNLLDEKTHLENAVKDAKEVELLQQRTHEFLEMYYRYRLELGEAKVDHVARTTSEGTERIDQMQTLVNTTMQKWEDFLNNKLRPHMDRVPVPVSGLTATNH